jgi:hypothetical protein
MPKRKERHSLDSERCTIALRLKPWHLQARVWTLCSGCDESWPAYRPWRKEIAVGLERSRLGLTNNRGDVARSEPDSSETIWKFVRKNVFDHVD